MIQVLKGSWALLLGMMLLMVGNGMQGTLLGIRGGIEGFSTYQMSVVMSAYFLGFLGGSKLAPEMIRRVGHVRVFAALGSMISAVLVLYPALVDPVAWTIGRVVIGFCFSGVYVTAESWLNNAATNENRGKALSLYMIVQMVGIVAAQGILVTAEPSGFILFVIPSVLVSVAFAPILLSISPTPSFAATKAMTLLEIWRISPLGCVGMFMLGGVFSAQFGMAAVYGTERGLTVGQISAFVSAIYIGALVLQYPIGWMSDRMDRRILVTVAAGIGAAASLVAIFFGGSFTTLLAMAFVLGGMSNPLYSLLIAYVNDHLQHEDMAAASGMLIFVNGIGAIAGPLITGWMIGAIGPEGFWLYIAILMGGLMAYALWRMTRRASVPAHDTGSYAPISMAASPVAVGLAQDLFIEAAQEEENAA